MIGNVWEWTQDWWSAEAPRAASPCCAPRNPRGGTEEASGDPACVGGHIARKVRAVLLPALPAGGAACATSRHLDLAHRFPLRAAGAARRLRLAWSRGPVERVQDARELIPVGSRALGVPLLAAQAAAPVRILMEVHDGRGLVRPDRPPAARAKRSSRIASRHIIKRHCRSFPNSQSIAPQTGNPPGRGQ
jgi:hypothetical protein